MMKKALVAALVLTNSVLYENRNLQFKHLSLNKMILCNVFTLFLCKICSDHSVTQIQSQVAPFPFIADSQCLSVTAVVKAVRASDYKVSIGGRA